MTADTSEERRLAQPTELSAETVTPSLAEPRRLQLHRKVPTRTASRTRDVMKEPNDPKKESLMSPITSPLANPTRIATAARVHAFDAKTENNAKATVAIFEPRIKELVSSLPRRSFTLQDQLSKRSNEGFNLVSQISDARELAKLRRQYLILAIAVAGVLSASQLGMLVVDYADSTASANMIAVKLAGSELGQIENGSLSVHMDLVIANPARGHVNITYMSFQLVVEGEYIAGGSRTFSPILELKAISSVDLHLTLDIPDAELQAVLHAPKKAVELLLFIATKTNYNVGTLRFTLQP